MHSLTTRNAAERWLTANPTPAPAQLTAFLDNHPRVLPQGPAEAPSISLGLLRLVLCLMLALAIAAAFFLFGEERPDSVVRPALTNAQRATAFHLPYVK